jgi:hypothetical protein
MPVGIPFPRLRLLVGPELGQHLEKGVFGLYGTYETGLSLKFSRRRRARGYNAKSWDLLSVPIHLFVLVVLKICVYIGLELLFLYAPRFRFFVQIILFRRAGYEGVDVYGRVQ